MFKTKSYFCLMQTNIVAVVVYVILLLLNSNIAYLLLLYGCMCVCLFSLLVFCVKTIKTVLHSCFVFVAVVADFPPVYTNIQQQNKRNYIYFCSYFTLRFFIFLIVLFLFFLFPLLQLSSEKQRLFIVSQLLNVKCEN